MIDAFSRTFSLMLKRPMVLLPALINTLLHVIMADLLFDQIVDIQVGVGFMQEYALGGFLISLLSMVQSHFVSFAIIGLVTLVFSIINILFIFTYARMAKGESLGQGFGYALSRLKDSLLVLAFLLILGVLGLGLFLAAFVFDLVSPLLTGIIIFIGALIVFYLYLRLLFTISIMALDHVNLKKALQASWSFTNKKTITVFIMLLIIGVINAVLIFIESLANMLFETLGVEELLLETLGFGLLPFLAALALAVVCITYSSLVFPLYYLKPK